jgi:glycosyl hydrolase family 26
MTRSALDTPRRARPRKVVAIGALVLVAAAIALAVGLTRSSAPALDKRVCAYSSHSIASLNALSRSIGRDVDCAVVFNNASPDWAGWQKPWFTRSPPADHNWTAWATAPGKHRTLIISQNLFPSSLNGTNWRQAGASGAFTGHAKTLARNLVAAGLGHSVIRLSHEANGTWGPDNIGSNDAQFAQWRQFWRNTVLAMKSVPGAHFKFDWTINARVRPISLAKFYPGDDVVDIVGIDAYDVGVPPGQNRWTTLYNSPDGIGDVVRFARAHGKPLSFPEWGIGPQGGAQQAGGDDPAYVNGIARVVRKNDTAYQAYFYSGAYQAQLKRSPRSLAAYRRHFGANGDSAP